jgi:hypothetical protein
MILMVRFRPVSSDQPSFCWKIKKMVPMKNLLLRVALLVFVLLTITTYARAQLYSYGFARDFSIPVYRDSVNTYKYPWTGGLNSAHFNSIDLNFDGIKDLVIFDVHTERVLPFINVGTPNQPNYLYAPQYDRFFPKITGWMRMRDFDGDGKEDIFCYAYGAIRVYKNVSSNDTLKFSLHTPILMAWEGMFPTNIMVTDFDFPSIEDMDGDGDLDIVVPAGLGGSTMHHYKNLAIEKTGFSDTLWYVLNSRCYGWFAENDTSNELYLNIDTISPNMVHYCLPGLRKGEVKVGGGAKHTGASLTMLDLNGDNLMDILLGDTDYPNVAALILQGHVDTPRVVSYVTHFPAYDVPIELYSLATVDYIDVDNDGKRDLLVGALDPSWEVPKAENREGVWWYKNTGTAANPVFSLQTRSFLQDQMIDVGSNSHPVLFDYNNDGLLDLFVGTFGWRDSSWMDPGLNLYSRYISRIYLFKNIGTATQPAFRLVDDDFANVSSLGLVGAYPTFGDLNGDGKPDMLLGDTTGRLHLFLNTSPSGYPMVLSYSSSNYQGIDVGQYGTPQLFDLDKDGLTDLIMGYRRGVFVDTNMIYTWRTSLAYFRNTGTQSQPQFTLITDTLGGINVNDSYYHYYDGYSSPCFFRDSSGVTQLFVGSGTGLIFYYNNIDGNLAGVFGKDSNMVHTTDYDTFYSVLYLTTDDGTVLPIDMKRKSAVTVGNLNGDQYLDLIIGNFSGGLNYFVGTPPPGIGIREVNKAFAGDVTIYPNPALYTVNVAIAGADHSIHTVTSVYSLTGQLLQQVERQGDDVFPVNISQLTNGLYIMKIDVFSPQQGTRATFNRKLVVKR